VRVRERDKVCECVCERESKGERERDGRVATLAAPAIRKTKTMQRQTFITTNIERIVSQRFYQHT